MAKVKAGETFSGKYFRLTQDLTFNSKYLDNYTPVGCMNSVSDTPVYHFSVASSTAMNTI